jgi:hypothetical protein
MLKSAAIRHVLRLVGAHRDSNDRIWRPVPGNRLSGDLSFPTGFVPDIDSPRATGFLVAERPSLGMELVAQPDSGQRARASASSRG